MNTIPSFIVVWGGIITIICVLIGGEIKAWHLILWVVIAIIAHIGIILMGRDSRK